jgi:protein sidekick
VLKHSFVNHYMSDPTYYNSWKRRPPAAAPRRYETVAGAEGGPHLHPVITTQSAGGVYTPAGARAPLTGFSSFV